nr:MAG TPA: hypothetical protein [Bacteriophage sp.]
MAQFWFAKVGQRLEKVGHFLETCEFPVNFL